MTPSSKLRIMEICERAWARGGRCPRCGNDPYTGLGTVHPWAGHRTRGEQHWCNGKADWHATRSDERQAKKEAPKPEPAQMDLITDSQKGEI